MKMAWIYFVFVSFLIFEVSAVYVLSPGSSITDVLHKEVEELKQNLSTVEAEADNAVNEVNQLKQQLGQEITLRISLEKELDLFKQRNFTSLANQLTVATDALAEMHLLRQLLNQETSFRMNLERELKQQTTLTSSLQQRLNSLNSTLASQYYELRINQSNLEKELLSTKQQLQSETLARKQEILSVQQNESIFWNSVKHNQTLMDSIIKDVDARLFDFMQNQSWIQKRYQSELQGLKSNQSNLDDNFIKYQHATSASISTMWSNVTEINNKLG